MTTCGLNKHRNTNHTEEQSQKMQMIMEERNRACKKKNGVPGIIFGGGGGGGQVTEGVYACLSGKKENHYCERCNVTPN